MSANGFRIKGQIQKYNYEALDNIPPLIKKPTTNPDGSNGQILRSKGDGTVEWANVGQPTDEQTAEAVSDWLDDHPEATTTVQDGSITKAKLNQSLADEIDEIPDIKDDVLSSALIEKEVSGSVVTFTDGANNVPVKNLITSINPKQNLNGYANPWPAGGGKNLYNPATESWTSAGVTFTPNSDGTITVSGTATATVTKTFSAQTIKAGTYTLNGCPPFGGSSTYELKAKVNNATVATDSGEGANFTLSADSSVTLEIYVYNGTSITSTVFKPMIRLASDTDATYAPYENICPISGTTDVRAMRTGKNLIPFPYESQTKTESGITFTVEADGGVRISGTATATVYFDVFRNLYDFPNGNFKIALLGLQGQSYPAHGTCMRYKTNSSAITNTVYIANGSNDITISDNTFLTCSLAVTNGTDVSVKVYPVIQSADFEGDVVYEPYQGETYTVTFPSEVGTVYGGTLNVATGELTVDRKSVDMGDLTWTASTGLAGRYYAALPSDSITPVQPSGDTNAVCDIYPLWTVGAIANQPDFTFYVNCSKFSSSKRVVVRDTAVADAAALKTKLSGMTLVYTLAEPITYQLSRTEVKTLLGDNSIWADAGDIDVTYRVSSKIYIDDTISESIDEFGQSITDDIEVIDDELQGVKEDLSALDDNLVSLAENGYYTVSEAEDVYIPLTSGWITTAGDVSTSDITKGYVWLTQEQEQESIYLDTSKYNYNICYMNGTTVTKYTGWSAVTPIVFDNTVHDKIGITVKKLSATDLRPELNDVLYYHANAEIIGNLATKNYVVPKQQSVSDAGKALVIDNNGLVIPGSIPSLVVTDDTLSISGDPADSKATGDRITELAEQGYFSKGEGVVFYQLTSGMINSPGTEPIADHIVASKSNGYVRILKSEIPSAIYYDNTKYKVNTLFEKNGYVVANTYTVWQTTSPVQFSAPSDYDSLYINVWKLSENYASGELNEALYKNESLTIGQLATKSYVDGFNPKGRKVIYPDGFESRIKPDIYYNGKYYANIDINNYKISGSGEIWVALDGNDTSGDGSENNPFATITKALTQSAVTIHIKEGTYEQGTHYATSAVFTNKNIIGHGTVILQNDSSGHYPSCRGNTYIENIIFKHGNNTTNPACAAYNDQANQAICFVDCIFRDGGSNGLQLTGIDAIVVNCIAYGNKLDGFNYHDRTISGVVYVPNVLEIDCIAYNNGSSESGSDSCNGSTAHDGTRIIRLNGEYYSCYGGVIAEIARTGESDPPTISVNYGVLAHDSTGTGTYKASFWASVNTKMYLYDCESYGGTYDISAINDALIVSRRLTTGRDEPAVNKGANATVYQY